MLAFNSLDELNAYLHSKCQKRLEQAHLDLLIVGNYVKQKKNILFVGDPGTGKTHLAKTLGLHAVTQGYKVRFWNALELVNQLELDSDSKNYKLTPQMQKQDIVILDELGYLPFSQRGDTLLFDFISKLHEQTSLIITTNLEFSGWTKLFTDTKMTNGLLDRLVHHCYILETGNESYRFKHRD